MKPSSPQLTAQRVLPPAPEARGRMRILFCSYEYPPIGGGGGVATASLAEEVAKRHDVTVLTSRALGLPARRLENGVEVIRVPVFFRTHAAVANLPSMLMYVPMGIQKGAALMRACRFDVINTHFAVPTGPVGAALSRRFAVPNVLSVHGGDLYDPSKWLSPHRHFVLRDQVRRLLRQADRVVAQSRNTAENVRTYYAPEIECAHVPLGIKRPPMAPASRSELGLSADDKLLISVGRLVPRKATDQLIRMMTRLRDEGAHLLLVGAGPEEAALKKLTAELGLTDRVHFTGFVEEDRKFRLLSMADVLVSSSQHEGFGLMFLEAMACGLPIVCYDHGGQTDFLEDAATGFVVRLNDEAAAEARIGDLIRDRDMRQRCAGENRRRVEDFFIDRTAKRYEDIFEKAIRLRAR